MKPLKLALTLCIGLCVSSCIKDPPPQLELSSDNITISSNGDPFTIEIKSNISWEIVTNLPDWLLIGTLSGQGNATIQVQGVPNTKYSRTSDVVISSTDKGKKLSASLRITQLVLNFKFDKIDILLEEDGKSVAVTLYTEGEWSVVNCSDWCMVNPTSGTGKSTINISALPNPRKKERTGSIFFKYYDKGESISITQKGNPLNNMPPEKPELIFPANNSIDISTYPHFSWRCSDSDGDTLTYTICLSNDGVNFTEYGHYTEEKGYIDNECKTAVTYYYKIKADDGDNGITYSDTYSFKTLHRPVYGDGEVITYMQSHKPKPVMLVFTGDGYIKQDCNVGGLFESNAIEGIEALFSVEPYKTYRDYFSVFIVFAHSLESGATQKDQNIFKMTAFSTAFEDKSTSMTTNTDKAFEYARKVPGLTEYSINNTCVFMMVNQNRYAGTCWMWPSGRSVAICPVSQRTGTTGYESIILHEGGGHGFGRLHDEYVNNNTQIPSSEVASNRASQSAGMFLNVDFINDPQKILWSHFIGLTGYNRAGVFEGAALYRYGAWRSEETNCMINNLKYYSVACREQIVKRILTISGEGYTLEKFLDNDWVRSPGASTDIETKAFDPKTFVPLAPPVVVR